MTVALKSRLLFDDSSEHIIAIQRLVGFETPMNGRALGVQLET
jgi:hypothetical protein